MPKDKKLKSAAIQFFTQAVGRLNPNGPQGYVALDVSNAPIRPTRELAYQDWLEAHGMAD